MPEQGSPLLPFAEDGVFIVEAESGRVLEALSLTRQRGAERINSDVAYNTGSHRPWKVSTLWRMPMPDRGLEPRIERQVRRMTRRLRRGHEQMMSRKILLVLADAAQAKVAFRR